MSEESDGLQPYRPSEDHTFPDERLNRFLELVGSDPEIQTYLDAQNVNPVARKGYNDHGRKHIEIVRDHALCLYELLKAAEVPFNGAGDQGLEEADESVIIALGATLHDIGHMVHRDHHPYYSIPLAADILDRILVEEYEIETAVRVKGEVLHAILCHHIEEDPLTTEAGVIRVADALDMEHGRSRLPYDKGRRGIDTLSSQAIQQVTLKSGTDRAALVEIEMTNAAGVYQVDELLKAKLRNSGLEEHVRIVAINTGSGGDQLVERLEL